MFLHGFLSHYLLPQAQFLCRNSLVLAHTTSFIHGLNKKCNFVSPLEKPGLGVNVMPAGTGRGWRSPMGCGLILPAAILGWEGNLPGAASSPRREEGVCTLGGGTRWPSACHVIGESAGTWEKVPFCLDAPDICICNPFGFQRLFNLRKCGLTAL